ncbi:transketolase [Brachybacterium sp. JHP9]|uniref:Transketolase n=1 Tax=Brachybacterium equifaecis TaxID=2910770 RepID=A0ABT0R390_9MICO|nr:transketolase [Brachybacterium equifaecis]
MTDSYKGIDGWTELDKRAIDTARVLAADAVQKVGNGHPGTAISLAPLAYLLYQDVMVHDPADTDWLGRDRFVLSAGHSSLTQYIQLFLGGFGLEMSDIEALRTFESKTPGHPEWGHTKGVETTTGPLGQGLATAVGMAMAQRRERGLLDPEAGLGLSPFDHYTYVIASDGDMQEGVTNEASSIAGTQKLGNLIVVWDDNDISIEGHTDIAFTEDTAARYEALGWHVQTVDWTNGGTEYVEDLAALKDAIETAKSVTDKPSFIALRTIIAWPSPKQGSHDSHGSALGDAAIAELKTTLGFDPERTFQVDEDVLAHTRSLAERAQTARKAWDEKFESWKSENPEAAKLLERLRSHELPAGWEDALPAFEADAKGVATRAASGTVLNALAPVLPELWGGSADLAGSNNTTMKGEPSFIPAERSTEEFQGNEHGRTLHFGIREHAMGAILTGINVDGLTRAYGGTFFQFADYMRGAVRLASLMGVPDIFVWTHDSVGLGEDGPTHQPVEHLAAYRAIPGLSIVRPADANETSAAWKATLEHRDGPVGLILTRQAVPTFDRSEYADASGLAKGGYVMKDAEGGEPDVILIATGSEVQYAAQAQKDLAEQGVKARLVSMPCVEWFDAQDESYRESVLPSSVRARVSVEAGIAQSWYKYLGTAGRAVSLEHFGASADAATLFAEYGFSADAVVAAAKESLEAAKA